jgi:hypothetical protein
MNHPTNVSEQFSHIGHVGPQRPIGSCDAFLGEGVKWNNLPFPLEGLSWRAEDHWTSTNSTDVEGS